MKKEIVIKIDEEKLKLIRKHGLEDNYILCDAATKAEAHVFTRTSITEYKEITNEMSDKDKYNLLCDLVYAIEELVKERDELKNKVGGE